MKTIITSSGSQLQSTFDKRFGRAAYFCLYNDITKQLHFFQNENAESSNGAGTKAAEKIIELGAQKVISGDFGPKAKEILEKFNVQMVIVQDDQITIEILINKLKH